MGEVAAQATEGRGIGLTSHRRDRADSWHVREEDDDGEDRQEEGRATLYKYFSDIESILAAWHERKITAHMDHLATVRDQDEDPGRRLRSVLEAYALMRYESLGNHDTGLAAILHKDAQVVQAEERLHDMVRDLLEDSAEAGDVRVDMTVPELDTYCLHALGAASSLRSRAAVHRLVSVTITGLTGRS